MPRITPKVGTLVYAKINGFPSPVTVHEITEKYIYVSAYYGKGQHIEESVHPIDRATFSQYYRVPRRSLLGGKE